MEFEQILRRNLSEQLFGLSIEDPDDHVSRFLVHLEIELDPQVIHVGLGFFSHRPHRTGVELALASLLEPPGPAHHRVHPARALRPFLRRLRGSLEERGEQSIVQHCQPVQALARLKSLAHLRRQVKDPALRAKLVPDYPIGAKRVLFNDDYYPALSRPNVELVTDAIERIEPEGVRSRTGQLHAADVIIYATGFKSTDFLAPMQVIGRDGLDLRQEWAKGARAYLGVTVTGFPNFWNIVILYLYIFHLSPAVNALILLFFAVLMLAPFKYITHHTVRFHRLTMAVLSLFAVALLLIGVTIPVTPTWLMLLSLFGPIYYLGMSAYLQLSNRMHPTRAK